MGCCQRSWGGVVSAHGVLSALMGCCQHSWGVVSAHGVLSALMGCCLQSWSVVCNHGVLLLCSWSVASVLMCFVCTHECNIRTPGCSLCACMGVVFICVILNNTDDAMIERFLKQKYFTHL